MRAAVCLVIGSVSLATELSPKVGPLVALGVSAVTGFISNVWTGRAMHRANQTLPVAKDSSLTPNDQTIRKAGFAVVRNMAWCIPGFGLLGLTDMIVKLVNPNDGWMDKAFGTFDVAEWFTIAGLLVHLNRTFLRTVVEGTSAKLAHKSKDDTFYSDLLQAQTGTYRKIANVLLFFTCTEWAPIVWKFVQGLLPAGVRATLASWMSD